MSFALEHRFSIAQCAPSWAKVPVDVADAMYDAIATDHSLELDDLPTLWQEIVLRCELEVSALGDQAGTPVLLGRRDAALEDAALDSATGILALLEHPIPTGPGVPMVPGVPWTDDDGQTHQPGDEPWVPEDDDELGDPEEEPADLPSADDDDWVGV